MQEDQEIKKMIKDNIKKIVMEINWEAIVADLVLKQIEDTTKKVFEEYFKEDFEEDAKGLIRNLIEEYLKNLGLEGS